MRLKPSRASQNKIDALVRAALEAKTPSKVDNMNFFKAELEKYVAKLEANIRFNALSNHNVTVQAAKARRMNRVANEQRDADIAILTRNSK